MKFKWEWIISGRFRDADKERRFCKKKKTRLETPKKKKIKNLENMKDGLIDEENVIYKTLQK